MDDFLVGIGCNWDGGFFGGYRLLMGWRIFWRVLVADGIEDLFEGIGC